MKVTKSQTHEQGWISVPIAEQYEERAKRMRAERDRQYGNIFAEANSDERWVGDLGEIAFNSWLKHNKINDHEWILTGAAGRPDFVLANGVRLGVKTVKRQGPPYEDYTAQITARHIDEPIDQFFFMSYDIVSHEMWLLGGIDQARFLQQARYYKAGDFVHPHYQIRPGHEIYNIEIMKLARPDEWLSEVIGL